MRHSVKINSKQAKFVSEYLVDFNGARAAIKAGYSKNGARVQACQLLARPEIQNYIQKVQDVRDQKSEVKSEWVIQSLKEVAERCMARYPIMVREGARLVQKKIYDEEGNLVGVWEFDSTGANRALELLGKYKGLFADRVHLGGDNGGPLQVVVTNYSLNGNGRAQIPHASHNGSTQLST